MREKFLFPAETDALQVLPSIKNLIILGFVSISIVKRTRISCKYLFKNLSNS